MPTKYEAGQPVRHVGTSCGKIRFDNVLQLNLSEEPERTVAKKLERIIDNVRERYEI